MDVLRAIAAGTGPAQWLVALGYAGWSAGQLDMEMTRHGWLNVPADTALIYEGTADTRWRRGFASAGIDPRMLAHGAGRA